MLSIFVITYVSIYLIIHLLMKVMRCIQLKKMNQLHDDDVDMIEVGVPALQDEHTATVNHPKCKAVLFRTDKKTSRGSYDEGIDIAAKLSEIEGTSEEQNPRRAALMPTDLLRVSPIPTEVMKLDKVSDQSSSSAGSSRCVTRKHSLNINVAAIAAEDKRRLCRELSRLDISFPQKGLDFGAVRQMRTRSADVAIDCAAMRTRSADVMVENAAMRNLRSAFKFGVTKLFRQVSDSFSSMF